MRIPALLTLSAVFAMPHALHAQQNPAPPAYTQAKLVGGVHDRTADRVGTTEIPVADIKNLPPSSR